STGRSVTYTLSLHDALPIWRERARERDRSVRREQRAPTVDDARHRDGEYPAVGNSRERALREHVGRRRIAGTAAGVERPQPLRRSEEHTSELQSRVDLVCRL